MASKSVTVLGKFVARVKLEDYPNFPIKRLDVERVLPRGVWVEPLSLTEGDKCYSCTFDYTEDNSALAEMLESYGAEVTLVPSPIPERWAQKAKKK